MPNPFPGMDPYLEGPFWTVFHSNFINEVARQLSRRLKPRYFALTEERVMVTTPDPIEMVGFGDVERPRLRYPDVGVFSSGKEGDIATEQRISPCITLDALLPEEITYHFVEIRDSETRSLVTAIEMLSPTNKRGDGQAEFAAKRLEYLKGTANYIEIDLLRIGERFPLIGTLPSVPYFVFLSRAKHRPRVDAWPIPLNQPLPAIRVPLLPKDGDAVLNLQEVIDTIYDLFSYEFVVDHQRNPVVPLEPEQLSWAESLLRAATLIS